MDANTFFWSVIASLVATLVAGLIGLGRGNGSFWPRSFEGFTGCLGNFLKMGGFLALTSLMTYFLVSLGLQICWQIWYDPNVLRSEANYHLWCEFPFGLSFWGGLVAWFVLAILFYKVIFKWI